MEFIESRVGDFLVVSFSGKLDPASQKELEKKMTGFIEQGDNKLIVDCSGLTYISSSGLRILLLLLKKSTAAGGTLRLCGVHHNIREIIIIAGFTAIFRIFETPEEAAGL